MSPFLSAINRTAKQIRDDLNGSDESDWATFRNRKIKVIVNHAPTEKWANGEKDRKNPVFLPEAFSAVDVLLDDCDPPPRIGEVFTEPDGMTHRIQYIATFHLHYKCLCKHTTI
jgi:hypothetical protein